MLSEHHPSACFNMKLTFYKYQGTGNDFIMVDDRSESFDHDNIQLVSGLCDRKFGVGADGLILIRNRDGYDFEMIYFNPDGTQSMCGNGARCAVAFSQYLGIISGSGEFLAIDGPHVGRSNDGQVELSIRPVAGLLKKEDDYFVDTGSPHHVRFVDHVNEYPVVEVGKQIRNSSRYSPYGSNVNFVSKISADQIYVRTYERGVENETLSCGTGVTASALVFGFLNGIDQINIQTPGGSLGVRFTLDSNGGFQDIFLTGPAVQVFQGTMELMAKGPSIK